MYCFLLLIVIEFTISFTFLDVHPAFAQYLTETTYSCDYIQSIPSTNTTIILPNWTCNEVNYTTFDFSRFTDLEYLKIGSDSFGFVETFNMDGMHKLTTLIIGSSSFTESKYAEDNRVHKSFHVKNCELLASIEIANNAFSDYSGEFELANLPSLKTISIGSKYYISYNFFHSSFVVRGKYSFQSCNH